MRDRNGGIDSEGRMEPGAESLAAQGSSMIGAAPLDPNHAPSSEKRQSGPRAGSIAPGSQAGRG
jgi:hypothetical protein